MTEEEFIDAQDDYGMDAFTANIGAEAIREMLSQSIWKQKPNSCAQICRSHRRS